VLSSPVRHPLVVYLPVVRGEESRAQRTLQQVLDRSVEACRVVVLSIDGARPAGKRGANAAQHVQTLYADADPRGPMCQALLAARSGAPHDVLLVRPGCEPPQAWDARLRVAAYAGANVGTASPLSVDRLEIRASEEPPLGIDVVAVDRYVYAHSRCRVTEIDVCGPLCCYLRHEAVAVVGDEIAAYPGPGEAFLAFLSHRLRAHGYSHAMADHVFVGGREDRAPKPTILRLDAAAAGPGRPHYLAALAQTVCEALRSPTLKTPIAGVDDPPVRLHLMHSWGGGLCRWVQDYTRADPSRVNLVLRPIGTPTCFAEGLALYRHVDDGEPIRRWRLEPPIEHTAITHLQYRSILEEVIEAYGVGGVMVSSFLGHSLDALCLDTPTLLVCHDYYPFCPALNTCFDGVCTQCDTARLAQCLAENRYTHLLRRADPHYWADLRERFVGLVRGRQIPQVAPSASVPRGLRRLEPRLEAAVYHVQPHGMEQQAFRPVQPPRGRAKLQAVILGRITPEKGADLLWDAWGELAPFCEITLLGCGDHGPRFAGQAGIRLVPRYEPEELPALLEELAPDFGLALSPLPETFSYTLSELMCAGIPPVATKVGSFVDRIEHDVTGFLIETRSDDLVRTVRMLHANPSRLATVRRNLCRRRHVTLAEMLAGYDRLLPAPAFSEQRYVRARAAVGAEALPAPQVAAGESFSGLLDRVLSEETFVGLVDRVYEVFRHKLARTPRLKNWQRPLVHVVVGGGYRVLKWSQRLARYRHRWRKAA
jgi:glycosyltransferase involved in cell wall biosynthesis